MKVIGHLNQAVKGETESKVISELKPQLDDIELYKRGYDGFWKSDLEKP